MGGLVWCAALPLPILEPAARARGTASGRPAQATITAILAAAARAVTPGTEATSGERQRRHADRLATAQTGSTVADTAPNAPANPGFDLVLRAAAGSALGSSGAPYTLTISAIDLTAVTQAWPALTYHQVFGTANGWELSGTGPDYQCSQTFPVPLPGGGPGGPLTGHALLCVASLVSQGGQIASIIHSDPFVLV